ncbi:MAG: hypothetical protein AB8H79_13680 [Myxococcota bacterium]
MVGCAAEQLTPMPESVSPAKGFFAEDRTIEITGQGMYPLVLANASGANGQIDANFTVELLRDGVVERSLSQVRLLEANRLQAVVPAGMDLHTYDLRVVDPKGRMGLLPDAYQATSSKVERLGLSLDGVVAGQLLPAVAVNDTLSFDVHLFDETGDRVPDSIPLYVSVESVNGTPLQATLDGELQGLADSAPGLALSGQTFSNGTGRVDLTLHEPGDVVLTVSTPDVDLGLDDVVIPLSWVAGTVYDVDIELPSDPFITTAGRSFVAEVTLIDQETRLVVTDPELPVSGILFDSCGDLSAPIDLTNMSGTRQVPLTLRRATGTFLCDDQRLQVRLDGDVHSSATVQVNAGEFAGFTVEVANAEVRAGRPVQAIVRPVDRFRNPVPWNGDPADLVVSDSHGDVLTTGCQAGDAFAICTVTPTVTSPAVFLRVREPSTDTEGVSGVYAVLPGPVDSIAVEPSPDALSVGVVAGEDTDVRVAAYDEFGNLASLTLDDTSRLKVGSEAGGALCTLDAVTLDGQAIFGCQLIVATPNEQLTVALDSFTARSTPFAVVNNALETIELNLSTATVVAGESFSLSAAGFDGWGNLYLVQTTAAFDLWDETGTLSLRSMTFDSSGRASDVMSIERAGSTTLSAGVSGVTLGTSPPLLVSPAAAQSLAVYIDEPWGWLGETALMGVQALDTYGNVADVSEDVVLRGDHGTIDDADVELNEGEGTVRVEFIDSNLSEVFNATSDTGLTGQLRGVPVVEDCGSASPSVVLSFGMLEDAIACHDGTDADIDATFAGSTTSAGGAPALFGVAVDGGMSQTSSASFLTAKISRVGRFDVRGLVAGSDRCATEVLRSAYVGFDDGNPVGPIDVQLTSDSLEAGVDRTLVSLSNVAACDGDPASKAKVRLRSDRGVITGATASGKGLEVTLDTAGDGSATLDLSTDTFDGDGVVTASVSSGAALGRQEFTVTGDSEPIRVLTQDPVGTTSKRFDVIELVFSEPVDTSTAPSTAFVVSGPTAVDVDSVSWSADKRVVEIWLDEEVDGADGRWSARAMSTISDASGNRLRGAWTSSIADHVGVFGDVLSTTAAVTSCTAASGTIRPDGDAGTGSEADVARVSVAASQPPTRWVMDVRRSDDTRVAYTITSATGKTAGLTWNARGLDGRIVDDGTYDIVVTAQNIDGTSGKSCTASVVLDNARGG